MKRLVMCSCVVVALFMLVFSQQLAEAGVGAQSPGGSSASAGQLLVQFRASTPRDVREATIRARGGVIVGRITVLDVEVAEFPVARATAGRHSLEAVIEALRRSLEVDFVEPNFIYRVRYLPHDPAVAQQWAWDKIQAHEAWDVTQGSASVVVAVVDTGIQLSHPDLDAKLVAGYDYVGNDAVPDDGHGHGTHVAGTIAAETGNGVGGAGLCPACRLMPVRVLDDTGAGTVSQIASGITFAVDHGAGVINLSVGSNSADSRTLRRAVDYAWKRGAFLACAAGNDGTSNRSYPAAYRGCFAVASTTRGDERSASSNYGRWVQAAAPGEAIYSTSLGGEYSYRSGTSMAAPHVAGLAGLLAAQGRTNVQIRDRICAAADKVSGTDTFWACGRINAYRATAPAVAAGPSAGGRRAR